MASALKNQFSNLQRFETLLLFWIISVKDIHAVHVRVPGYPYPCLCPWHENFPWKQACQKLHVYMEHHSYANTKTNSNAGADADTDPDLDMDYYVIMTVFLLW